MSRRIPFLTGLVTLVAVLGAVATLTAFRLLGGDGTMANYLARSGWPTHGQAAYALDDGRSAIGPNQQQRPIASLAKVMTAYVVLHDHPLGDDDDGPTITVTGRDVTDYEFRRDRDESVVPVRAGERLTERQALLAMLVPSGNNVAALLARWDVDDSGDLAAFVRRMNDTAYALGMRHSDYTDPSGFDPATSSTAADQLRLARAAAGDRTLTTLVAQRRVALPYGAVQRTTNSLLGQDGFVGTKTGSDDAAGGCFMFRVERPVRGRQVTLLGVVLDQPGADQLGAGLKAGHQLADEVYGDLATRRGTPRGVPRS